MSEGQRSRSKCQKLRITSSVIVTDIPIIASSFRPVVFELHASAFTLPWPWPRNQDLKTISHDLNILNKYHHTKNEVASSSHSKGITCAEKIRKQFSRSKLKVKAHQLPTTSSVHRGTYSYQVTSISDSLFSRFCADRRTHRRRRKQHLLSACAQVMTGLNSQLAYVRNTKC